MTGADDQAPSAPPSTRRARVQDEPDLLDLGLPAEDAPARPADGPLAAETPALPGGMDPRDFNPDAPGLAPAGGTQDGWDLLDIGLPADGALAGTTAGDAVAQRPAVFPADDAPALPADGTPAAETPALPGGMDPRDLNPDAPGLAPTDGTQDGWDLLDIGLPADDAPDQALARPAPAQPVSHALTPPAADGPASHALTLPAADGPAVHAPASHADVPAARAHVPDDPYPIARAELARMAAALGRPVALDAPTAGPAHKLPVTHAKRDAVRPPDAPPAAAPPRLDPGDRLGTLGALDQLVEFFVLGQSERGEREVHMCFKADVLRGMYLRLTHKERGLFATFFVADDTVRRYLDAEAPRLLRRLEKPGKPVLGFEIEVAPPPPLPGE